MREAEPLSPKPRPQKRPAFIAVLALLQGISAVAAGIAAILALFGWKGLEGPLWEPAQIVWRPSPAGGVSQPYPSRPC